MRVIIICIEKDRVNICKDSAALFIIAANGCWRYCKQQTGTNKQSTVGA